MVAVAVGAATCAAGFPFFASCAALCSLYFVKPIQPPAPSSARTTTDAVMTKTFSTLSTSASADGVPDGSGAPAKRRPDAGTVVLCRVVQRRRGDWRRWRRRRLIVGTWRYGRRRSGGRMRRLWHDDGLLARRAVDLRAGIARITLDVLAALRAGKFEFSHNVVGIGFLPD